MKNRIWVLTPEQYKLYLKKHSKDIKQKSNYLGNICGVKVYVENDMQTTANSCKQLQTKVKE